MGRAGNAKMSRGHSQLSISRSQLLLPNPNGDVLPFIEDSDYKQAIAAVRRYARKTASSGEGSFVVNLEATGTIITQELAYQHRRLEDKLAEDIPADDLDERIMDEEYRRARTISRSLDSRLGYMYETMSARLARVSFGEGPPDNLLYGAGVRKPKVPPLLRRQKYLDKHVHPLIVTNLDRDVVKAAADEITANLWNHKDSPRIGSPEFQKLLKHKMVDLRMHAPKGPLWGQTIDLALTHQGVEFLELKSGGELHEKALHSEVKNMVVAALAYNHGNVKLRFGFYKDVRGTTQSKLPGVFDYTSKHAPVLVGQAYWEHILPDNVTYDNFLDLMETAGKYFRLRVA